MKLGSRQTILGMIGTVALCLVAVPLASAQAAQGQKPQMSEDVFKNVLVLKGMPVDEFMDTMGMIAASLSMNCVDCHTLESLNDWSKFADDTDLKKTARRMMLMMNAINRQNFNGARMVTCYTCHRGDQRPKVVPSLTVQYSLPVEDPNDVNFAAQAGIPGLPSVDEVFDKYIQAIGGAQRANSITSVVGKGTYEGYDTDLQKVPVEVYAKAPDQRTTLVHLQVGESVRVYNGRDGWIAAPDKPVPLLVLTGGELNGARTEAIVTFPGRIRQSFSQWKVAETAIEDRPVTVLQGSNPGAQPVNLYFDKETGLLVRLVRFVETAIGTVPTQIDYSDFRDVSGVKMPFKWVKTWTDGQTTTELSELQPNTAIPATRFARPAPSPPPKVAAQ